MLGIRRKVHTTRVVRNPGAKAQGSSTVERPHYLLLGDSGVPVNVVPAACRRPRPHPVGLSEGATSIRPVNGITSIRARPLDF